MSNQDNMDLMIEEELQKAMKLLKQPMEKEDFPEISSPTLSALDKTRQSEFISVRY